MSSFLALGILCGHPRNSSQEGHSSRSKTDLESSSTLSTVFLPKPCCRTPTHRYSHPERAALCGSSPLRGKMIRKIVLVREAPESHDRVAAEPGGGGFQVVPQATLRAAVSVLRDAENAALVVLLDGPSFSEGDAEVLACLSVKHPQMRMMVFVSRGVAGRDAQSTEALSSDQHL